MWRRGDDRQEKRLAFIRERQGGPGSWKTFDRVGRSRRRRETEGRKRREEDGGECE
jgi:hypothetical protein